jgi:hypothetical protein
MTDESPKGRVEHAFAIQLAELPADHRAVRAFEWLVSRRDPLAASGNSILQPTAAAASSGRIGRASITGCG